jgi:uncharacterized RDD family membrane protein YckC
MEWYYKLGDVRGGPVDHDAICRMVTDGLLPLDARVWREGFSRFLPASILPGFRDLKAAAESKPAEGAAPARSEAAEDAPLTAPMIDPWSPPADADLDALAPPEQTEQIDQSQLIGVRAYFAGGQLMSERAPDVTQARPWVRFWARSLDGLLYSFVVLVVVLPALRPHLTASASLVGWWPVLGIPVGMVCLQAAMLSLFGTTPGKLLLGTSVRTMTGEKLGFGEALSRECGVLVRGQALGLGLFSALALLLSYRRLSRDGTTSWDEFGGFVVRHERIGAGRAMLAFLGCAMALAVTTPPLMAATREASKLVQEQSKAGVSAGSSTGSPTGGRTGPVSPTGAKPKPARKAPPKKIIM